MWGANVERQMELALWIHAVRRDKVESCWGFTVSLSKLWAEVAAMK